MLSGRKVGNDLYNMRRCRDALTKLDPHCSELLILRGLIDRVVVAQKLAPNALTGHSKKDRHALIDSLNDNWQPAVWSQQSKAFSWA